MKAWLERRIHRRHIHYWLYRQPNWAFRATEGNRQYDWIDRKCFDCEKIEANPTVTKETTE